LSRDGTSFIVRDERTGDVVRRALDGGPAVVLHEANAGELAVSIGDRVAYRTDEPYGGRSLLCIEDRD
jgi:hypothetical protein